MRYKEIAALRAGSPAWRLLRADNAPLMLSFLGRVFVDDNVRDISAPQLISRLDDELFVLNERLGEGTYPEVGEGLPRRLGGAGVRLASQVLPARLR